MIQVNDSEVFLLVIISANNMFQFSKPNLGKQNNEKGYVNFIVVSYVFLLIACKFNTLLIAEGGEIKTARHLVLVSEIIEKISNVKLEVGITFGRFIKWGL